MVLNNVTKFHKILKKNIQVRERTLFKAVNFHKQRAITTESLERYGPLSNLKEDIMVLNNVTKFHKILKKNIQVRERTMFKTVNFHKQRAITTERLERYGPLSNLKEDIMVLNNVTKFHTILIKSIRFRERTSSSSYVRTYGQW